MSILEEVKEWLENYEEDEARSAMEELQKYGCVSGIVPGLIYYNDTFKFFERNLEEIEDIIKELATEMGDPGFIQDLKGYDLDDPLFTGNNKNLLAWLAFEEVAYRYYREKFED